VWCVDSEGREERRKRMTGKPDFRFIDLIDDLCNGKDVFFRFVRTAQDIMAQEAETLTLDDTVEAALLFMKERKVRHVPVMDLPVGDEEGEYFVGVISERDLFRQISPYVGKSGELDSDRSALRRKLTDIVTRKPTGVSPETPLAEVMATMIDNHADIAPVLAKGELVGMITSGDIVKLYVRLDMLRRFCAQAGEGTRLVDLFSGRASEGPTPAASLIRSVRDIMTKDVACLGVNDDMAKAMETMQEGKFRHLPIVDTDGKLAGMISDRDVLLNLTFPSAERRPDGSRFRGRLFSVDDHDPSLRLAVRRIMKTEVECVSADCDVYGAAKKLHETGVSCLPVVDEQGGIEGIMTVTDLMRGLLVSYKLSAGLG